jgi:hypothetical protein
MAGLVSRERRLAKKQRIRQFRKRQPSEPLVVLMKRGPEFGSDRLELIRICGNHARAQFAYAVVQATAGIGTDACSPLSAHSGGIPH